MVLNSASSHAELPRRRRCVKLSHGDSSGQLGLDFVAAASGASVGDMMRLNAALNHALDAGLTISNAVNLRKHGREEAVEITS